MRWQLPRHGRLRYSMDQHGTWSAGGTLEAQEDEQGCALVTTTEGSHRTSTAECGASSQVRDSLVSPS